MHRNAGFIERQVINFASNRQIGRIDAKGAGILFCEYRFSANSGRFIPIHIHCFLQALNRNDS